MKISIKYQRLLDFHETMTIYHREMYDPALICLRNEEKRKYFQNKYQTMFPNRNLSKNNNNNHAYSNNNSNNKKQKQKQKQQIYKYHPIPGNITTHENNQNNIDCFDCYDWNNGGMGGGEPSFCITDQ